MKKKIKTSKAQVFILLLLISVFVLITPQLIRFFQHSSIMAGDEPYYHARVARQIIEEGMPLEDEFIHGSRPYLFNPYHSVIALFSLVFGVIFASKLVPFVCGMLSVLFFYLILKRLGFGILNRIVISIVFILSPVFIYIFSLSTPFCIIALLDLLGFYLFIQKEKWDFTLAVVVLSIASFFSLANLAIILITTLAYVLFDKKKLERFYTLLFFISLIFLVYYIGIYFKFGMPLTKKLIEANLIQSFVADLGGMIGFSIFTLLLAVLGLAIAWKEKKKLYYVYLIMLFVVAISFLYNNAVVYSNFAISILAGIAFAALIRRKWELKLVRNLSIILLFCSILFSAVSYTVRISNEQPTSELMDALEWISQNSNEGDVVFSHYTKGFWVQFHAQRPVVADSITANYPDFKEKIRDSEVIFDSWDIKETRKLLQKHNASFVLITNDMAEGLVWEKPEQGLAYLLRNSETFKKVYSNSHAGVWRYIYSEND